MELEWSPYQNAVFEDMARGSGHTVVTARAGAAKTTTLVAGVGHIESRESTLVCAFGKDIERTLKERMRVVRPRAHVQTLHSFGRRVITLAAKKNVEFQFDKVDRIMDSVIGSDRGNPFISSLRFLTKKVVALAKSQFAHTPEEIDELLDTHGLDVSSRFRVQLIDHALAVMEQCKKPPPVIDFDDQIWLPEVLGLPVPQYDRVMIDEAQDMTPAQIKLALRACKPKTGRITAIGDDKQAIFAWRGAYAGVLDEIVDRYGAKRLPLPISYRCPRKVIEYAKMFVPDIEPSPWAIEGVRESIDAAKMMSMVSCDDFILSRLNAPLVALSFMFIRQGRRVRVAGRDNSQRIVAFIRKSGAGSVDQLLHYTREWLESERDRLGKKKRATALVEDLAETIEALADNCPSIGQCIERAQYIFGDDDEHKPIVLSSVHKAKGLERDRVFLLEGTFRIDRGGEESNIAYVAATRAKVALYHVSGFEKQPRRKR